MSDTSSSVSYNTYTHTFGILIPNGTGVEFTHQSGGMSCTQLDFEGVFLPLKRPTMYLDAPEWKPSPGHANSLALSEDDIPDTIDAVIDWVEEYDRLLDDTDIKAFSDADIPDEVDEFLNWIENTVDVERKSISDVDLTSDEIPERDFESFPDWVQERGYFYDYDEYHYWLNQDEVDWYGRLDLIEEQRLWEYDPSGEMHRKYRDYDPTEKWESRSEIWDEIDASLPFEYEEWDAWEAKQEAIQNGDDPEAVDTPIPDSYPEHGAAFKWIQIQGSKRDGKGRVKAQWADDLEGEYVILTYDNVD